MKKFLKETYKRIPFKQPLFNVVKKVVTPSESLYRHLHFEGDFPVEIDDAHKFLIRHYGFELENEVFWRGLENGWEKASIGLWIKLVENADVVFDIGASTGIYSLITKALNPRAEVYAFEPIERVFQKLEENVRLNRYDVHCFEAATSDTDGTATIYDTPSEHMYSVTVNENTLPEGTTVIPVQIQIVRLDTFIERENIEKIDLIKLDVETHEAAVLEGMGKYLDEFKPILLIEILNDGVGERVEKLVSGKGYLYFNIDDVSGSIRRVERITKSDLYNYLLCSETVARELDLLG